MSGAGRDGDQVLVEVAADRRDDRAVVRETLWVESVGGGGYRLVKSPLVAQGLAVGDEFEIEASDKSYRIARRGGNLCVQLFMKPELTRDVFDHLAGQVRAHCGAFDSHTASIAGFWIPIGAGFRAVEQLFDGFVTAHQPGAAWMFSNVYGEDGQPLNWW